MFGQHTDGYREHGRRLREHASTAADSLQDAAMRLRQAGDKIEQLRDALTVCLGHLTGGMDGEWRDCDPIVLAREMLEATKP